MPGPGKTDGGRQRRYEQWAATIKDRALLLLVAVTVAGIALVAAGWIIQGAAYVPALVLQLGASMMLLVPLALLGFMLEGRLRRTEEQLQATAARLDTLTAVTRERLAESRRQRDEMFESAKRAPAQDKIRALLDDGSQVGAIDPSGPRVKVPGSSLRLRFRQHDNSVEAQVEEADGTELERVAWNAGEAAEIFTQRLAERLETLDRYPGDASFDPAAVIQQLLEIIELGVRSRTGEYPRDLGHLIEIPNQQWAISTEGLFSLQHHYQIPAQRITQSHEDWPRHMRTLAWVDAGAFDEAYLLARHLLKPR
jgi:hypothetical protein